VFVRIFSLLQVFVVMAFAPLGEGAVMQLKEIVRSSYGRRLHRSRRDVWKTLYNVETISDHRSRDFRYAPDFACSTPVFVALLFPALTSNPLLFARMDDILAGRFVFGKFFAALTAVNTANTSDRKSASRSRVRVPRFPLEFVFTGFVSPAQIVAGSIVPYVVQIKWPTLGDHCFGSSCLLVMAFFFMPIAGEHGCITIYSASRQFEAAMLDRSKPLEHSGLHVYVHG
jgi:formate hydrogenlyase subunit 4